MSLESLLVTFEPHPLAIVNPADAPPILTVGDEKLEIVAESGITYMGIVPFTPRLMSYGPREFVDRVLVRRFGVRHLVIGYDHGFGRGREGDVDLLRELGEEHRFGVDVVPALNLANGQAISSTLIRRAVAAGDLELAAEALGRRYSISGQVVRGDQRGRTLGFPTINLSPAPPMKLLPPGGVYAVRVQTPAGPFGGMMNLGARPTFDDPVSAIEVHLFDAAVDLYGAAVRVDFFARIRDTRRFANVEALIAQLRIDAEESTSALTLLNTRTKVRDSSRSVISSQVAS